MSIIMVNYCFIRNLFLPIFIDASAQVKLTIQIYQHHSNLRFDAVLLS